MQVVKTIGQNAELSPVFSADEPPTGRINRFSGTPSLPAPGPDPDALTMRLIRGCADVQGFYHAHHNNDVHDHQRPADIEAAAVFDALEQARCEALGARHLPGSARNINAVLAEKCKRNGYDKAQNRETIPLPAALHVLTRLALTGEDVPEPARNLVDKWSPWVNDRLGMSLPDYLKNHMPDNKTIGDQNAYADLSLALLRSLGLNAGMAEGAEPDAIADGDDHEQTPVTEDDAQDDSATATDEEWTDEDADTSESYAEEDGEPGEHTDTQPADGDDLPQETPDRPFFDHFMPGLGGAYTVYTTAFDEEVRAEDLADAFELSRLRKMLDQQIGHKYAIVTKLANKLQRKIMARQQRTWQFDLEEGILDGARLARIIANPTVPLTFKQEKEMPFRDTVVTLLIDNSGSMRGRPIAIAAMTADIVARTLERCGVKTEILGFTTRGWKGGRSRELWIENGSPDRPGRLNDLRHIIYKAGNSPMRRARKNLGLMLKEGILKENIDGEALAWAHNRLARRPEDRKILIVISDGAPVDDSTLSVNIPGFLEADLRNVIGWIERTGQIELAAIGIGHDVTRYYKNALTITDADELADALVGELADLFEAV